MLKRLVLWADGLVDLDVVRSEFPTVELRVVAGGVPQGSGVIHAGQWWGPPSVELDQRLEGPRGESGPEAVTVVAESAEEGARLALQVLTRYQHRIQRRNEQSRGPLFNEVLRRHRRLHELSHFYVRADFIHSLDTWQWVLRLDPEAGLAVQIAALFHDVERPIVEPAQRNEPVGPSYQALKDAHARAGARLTRLWLGSLRLDSKLARAAEQLIEGHERPAVTREQTLLNQADALSFISRGTDAYPASLLSWRLRRALAQLRTEGFSRLPQVRAAPEVGRILELCAPDAVIDPVAQLAAGPQVSPLH